jgi:hypothetical protein
VADITAIQQAKKWIYDILAADSALTAIVSTRIYADRVPPSPTFPYVLYNTMAGTDIQAVGTVREATNAIFQIRVVSFGAPDANARKADYRIDQVLRGSVSQTSGDFRFTSWRTDVIDRPEYDQLQNRQYHNLGGLYRLWITAV